MNKHTVLLVKIVRMKFDQMQAGEAKKMEKDSIIGGIG